MTVADNRLKDLVKLTKGRSKTDRTLLYRHIAHIIIQRKPSLENQNKAPDEAKILFELFDALSKQVEPEIRKELAQDLSRRESPPEELTKRLAVDEISIAESVLKSAPFSEKTLLNIIKSTDKAHHLIITERKDLSQKLWQTIVDLREGVKKPEAKEKAKEEKPTETPLIQFPQNTNATKEEGKIKKAVDLFVPSNDKSPPVFTPSKEMPPIPAFFLGSPPSKKDNEKKELAKEIQEPSTTASIESGVCWSVNRKGEIEHIDLEAEKIFNLSHDELLKSNLWHLFDMSANSDIYNAIIKRHPIRNLTVKLDKSGEQVRIIAHAKFELGSGRFTGFEGSIKPVEDNLNTRQTRTSKRREEVQKHQEAEINNNADTTSGHILAAHLSADAIVPIQDMLEGIQRIARAARRNNDEAMLTDIRAVMADCFKLRDMVEDTERIARMFGSGESLGDETFDVFKVLNSCLDDDTTRHGNVLNFQLLPRTNNPTVCFSRSVLRQAFARMLEIARESNSSNQLIPIYVHTVNDGRLEVAIPLGSLTGDKSIDNRELDTDDRLKLGVVHRKRSGDPVMTASLGLSTLSSSIERLGGKLDIVQNHYDPELNPNHNSSGSVSIRLPLA